MIKKVIFLLLIIICVSCGHHETPKPRGLFRIALPERSYRAFDESFPYRFEIPEYSRLEPDGRPQAEDYWADIVFDDFNARIHLSYKPVNHISELHDYFGDAYTFVHKHIPKATGIREETFIHPEESVYAMLFRIRGREAASAIQFYATDSISHFLRGALYFNLTPDNDSLAPVIDFLEEDIRHMIATLEWE